MEETNQKHKVLIFDDAYLTQSILSQLQSKGIEVVDPNDSIEIGNACDKAARLDMRLANVCSDIPEPCQDVAIDSDSKKPCYLKSHRHKGGHKANARAAKRKKK